MNKSDPVTKENLDLEILRLLSEDGRNTYHHIANELRKSPVTIKKHVEELEENGIIKNYSVNIDYEKLGYDIIALIEVIVSKGKLLDVEKKIAASPNVFGVYDLTGNFDALILARFKTRKDLSAMVKNILAIPYVERTNTHLVLNVIKDESSFIDLLKVERSI